jgi:probable phosphoglycerate mutase
MGRIFIVQHCQSEHHINELTGGWTDTPLTKHGENQAIEVAKELQNIGLSNDFELYSSDLKRASMTAGKIEQKFGQKMILTEILREHNNGLAAEKSKQWAKEHILFNSKKVELDKPLWEEAETIREIYDRVKKFSDSVLINTERDIVVVSHGGAIGYLIMSYLNLGSDSIIDSFISGSPGGISILSKSPMGQNTLNQFNSIAHLPHLSD